jgi:hypothetical protein
MESLDGVIGTLLNQRSVCMKEIKWANNEEYYAYLGKVAESFFHQLHMHRCITLNGDKVREMLDLIDAFSRVCDIQDEDWDKYQLEVVHKMRDFK